MATTSNDPNAVFGSPIYRDDPADDSPAHDESVGGDDSNVAVVDLNDPALLMQEVVADASADPYATPPPVSDGAYRAKLKQIDVKDENSQPVRMVKKQEMNYPGGGAPGQPVFLADGKTPKMYLQTAIEATILDPGGKFDNVKVYDRFFDSRIDRQGANKWLHLLKVLGKETPKPLNGKTLSEAVFKALAGEPEVDILTTWEGQPSQEDSAALKLAGLKAGRVKGQHRFPQVDGKHLPDIQVAVTDKQNKAVMENGKPKTVNLHAQATIGGIFPAGTKTKKK